MSQALYINQLDPSEFQPYFKPYIDLAGDGDVVQALETQPNQLRQVLGGKDNDIAMTIHSPYTWNLKQVVGHLIDGEKIFGCRALRIACAENLPLPGFDQDVFVTNTSYDHVALDDLLSEFEANRSSNLLMVKRWTPEMLQQSGICDGKSISVKAIVCLMVGHVNHHLNIVKQRLNS